MSQQSPEKVARRKKRKRNSAAWLRRIFQCRLEKWFDAGKLTIRGVDWPIPSYAQSVFDALRFELAAWVLGTKDIPCLRHYRNARLMHARGRLSMAKVLLAMSLVIDYRSNNIAVPYQDEHTGLWYWAGRSIAKIAEIAGVSYWACKRRIDWIVKQGLMSRHPQAGTDLEGQKYGRPSIRNLLEATLWKAIGKRTAAAVKAAGREAYRSWKDAQEQLRPVLDAAKLAAQRAAAAATRAAELTKRGSRPRNLAEIFRTIAAGQQPYLQKPAPS